MAADPIPASDAAFDTWVSNWSAEATTNKTTLGYTAPELADVTAKLADWQTKYAAAIAAQAAAQSANAAKDAARDLLEATIRTLMARFNATPGVTNSIRGALGWTEYSGTHTPIGAPTSSPGMNVDTSQRLQHTINFFDPAHPLSTAKPDGVAGCEIWVKIGGAPPGDLSECTYLATDTRTPYVAHYDAGQAGQTAHYIARWVSPRHEPGPLSAPVSATIPG